MLETWQTFYEWHDPVIFTIGVFSLRWYGLMYVTALVAGYLWGRRMVRLGRWRPMTLDRFESLFIWFVIGAILGARIGYVIFYDRANAAYLFSHPWQIFNPFAGDQIGISGLSYHGAIAGVVVSLLLFARRYRFKVWFLFDLAAVSGSAGYVFGRIGNFLNAELIGRETTMPWGVLADGVLRHPSALYEAFLEGVVIFAILTFFYQKRKFDGQMAMLYLALYAIARIIVEFFRAPDSQLGFIAFGQITMGQALSLAMLAAALATYFYLRHASNSKRG
ncbi:MAG: prolipoprotein diacylglyceryl transferase [Helicobacteraceae bacterium]|jgi:phosphatidylglycerol:prolipoprotein diacylglycerol transferase|nr:prolipoprotein diacylglyceryl transferase [Helicobacteraceae bacterium]